MTFKEKLLDTMQHNVALLLQLHDCDHSKVVHDDAVTDEICSILETVFMHNLSGRSNSLFSATSSELHQRCFWDFVNSILPKHISSLITNCSAGRTAIGRCRVWLRFCLNESTLVSYLTLVTTELNNHYAPDAVMRDSDFMRSITNLVESLSVLRFRLDLKSALLSTWINSKVPIYLGWAVEKVEEPECNLLQDTESHLDTLISPLLESSRSPHTSPNNEKESRHNSDRVTSVSPLEGEQLVEKSSDSVGQFSDLFTELDFVSAGSPQLTSSITTRSSRRLIHKAYTRTPTTSIHEFPIGSNNVLNQFRSTWLAYYTEREAVDATPLVSEQCASSDQSSLNEELSHSLPHVIQPNQTAVLHEGECSPWQIVGEDLLVLLTEKDVHRLVALYPGVSAFDTNDGLNCAFHGCCTRCNRPLFQGTAILDNYDACLYCMNCHQLQEAIIPRDVIYNWDFSLQLVSQTTKSFLAGLYSKPIINLAKSNPLLYAVIPDLLVIRQLRRTLILLWDQLCRCDGKAASDLRRALGSLDYMLYSLNDLDVYSLRDLCIVPDQVLEKKLMFAICEVALVHVHSCRSCRRRALICSLCENVHKPIWPHEFTTYKWCATSGCPNVMHIECLHCPVTTDDPSCFGCYPITLFSTPQPDSESLAGALCATCITYSLPLSIRGLGHYSDPLLSCSSPPSLHIGRQC